MNNPHRRILILGIIASIAMFGFGFALIPVYNAFCKTLGINGKTNTTPVAESLETDPQHKVIVSFVTQMNDPMPLEFHAVQSHIVTYPGRSNHVYFFSKNMSDHSITLQIIASVTPGLAAAHFKKTECFCFTQQTLAAHQAVTFPVVFHLDPELSPHIHEVTLSYTIYRARKIDNPHKT